MEDGDAVEEDALHREIMCTSQARNNDRPPSGVVCRDRGHGGARTHPDGSDDTREADGGPGTHPSSPRVCAEPQPFDH